MSITATRKKSDARRFKEKYPFRKARAEALNVIAAVKDNTLRDIEVGVVLTNYIQIDVPYSSFLSKNRFGIAGKHHFVLKETRELQDLIQWQIKAKRARFFTGKVWLDIIVQKPQARGDAVNYVDRVCDAVQKAIGINDYWFSLRRVDWQIVKKNPKIIIGIGQNITEEHCICSMCGRVLPLHPHFSKEKGNTAKPHIACKACRSKDVETIIV